MKRGRKQFTLGSLMSLIALCAIAFAFPEVSVPLLLLGLFLGGFLLAFVGLFFATLVAPLYLFRYLDRPLDGSVARSGPRPTASGPDGLASRF